MATGTTCSTTCPPSSASPPPAAAPFPPLADVVYRLTHSRPLPHIDTVRSIKHVLLSPQQLHHFNRFLRTWRRWLTIGYWTGVTLGTCTLFSPPSTGIPLAIVSMPLQLVPSVISVLAMRFDMALLVSQGYEFWYMTLSNAVVSALISFSFNDARCLVMVGACVAFETALLLDANHRASKLVSVATVCGALTNIAYVACATFGVIEYGRDLELLRYGQRVLYADDVIANLIATLVVLLVRNGVRKFRETESATTRMAHCITYRCRVALVAVVTVPSLQSDTQSAREKPPPPPLLPPTWLTQLQYIDDGATFSSGDTLMSSAMPWRRLDNAGMDWFCQRLLNVVSWTSLLSWLVAMFSANMALVRVASMLSACGAGLVFVSYLCFAQRQLFKRLATSFDSVFLSVQLTLTHACLADIVGGWTHGRACAVLASWLWIHWVLLLDAVLPIHKNKRLGFRRCVAASVLVIFLLEQVAVVAVLVLHSDSDTKSDVVDPRLELHDREIATISIHRHVKQLRVVPLLFGRVVTTLSWSLRLLWRFWSSRHYTKGEELLMLQGRVQYETSSTTGSSQWVGHTANDLARILPHPPS